MHEGSPRHSAINLHWMYSYLATLTDYACSHISKVMMLLPVLSHSMHAGLLAYGRDLSIADLVWPAHVVLKIHLLAQVHLGSTGLQHRCTPGCLLCSCCHRYNEAVTVIHLVPVICQQPRCRVKRYWTKNSVLYVGAAALSRHLDVNM